MLEMYGQTIHLTKTDVEVSAQLIHLANTNPQKKVIAKNQDLPKNK